MQSARFPRALALYNVLSKILPATPVGQQLSIAPSNNSSLRAMTLGFFGVMCATCQVSRFVDPSGSESLAAEHARLQAIAAQENK